MFHGRQNNHTITSFEEWLVEDKTFYNTSSKYLIIGNEMYKVVRNNFNYNLRSKTKLTVPSINTLNFNILLVILDQ